MEYGILLLNCLSMKLTNFPPLKSPSMSPNLSAISAAPPCGFPSPILFGAFKWGRERESEKNGAREGGGRGGTAERTADNPSI